MILTELTFFSPKKAKRKIFYTAGKKEQQPCAMEYKTSFLDTTFYRASELKSKKEISQAKAMGLNANGIFSVPFDASQLRISFSSGEMNEFEIRKPNFKERILLLLKENPEDEIYNSSAILTRPIFKTARKWFITIICAYLRLKYGSQKNNVLLSVPSPHRIGHGLANFDVANNEIRMGFFGKKPVEIFAFYTNSSPVQGQPSVKYSKPYYLSIFESGFIQYNKTKVKFLFGSPFYYSALCRLFRKTMGRIYPMRIYGHRDIFGCIKKSKPSFMLPRNIAENGMRFCKEQNIDINRPTILLANREPGGIVSGDKKSEIKRYGFRNTTIENYIPAIEYIARENNVIRIGKSNKKLNINIKSFYDLSTIPESLDKTKLDFYFASLCSFFIGTTSGIYAISQIMRKPIVWTNTVPIGHYSCWSDWDISLFKILQEKRTGKLVSFKRTLQLKEGWGQHAERFSGHYKFIENTDDEILEATKEMQEQLRNRYPNKQTYLNRKIIRHYPINSDLYLKHRGTVSEYFLKKHQNLI